MKYHQPKFTYHCIRTVCNKPVKTSNTELSGVGEYCISCNKSIEEKRKLLGKNRFVKIDESYERQRKYSKERHAKKMAERKKN